MPFISRDVQCSEGELRVALHQEGETADAHRKENEHRRNEDGGFVVDDRAGIVACVSGTEQYFNTEEDENDRPSLHNRIISESRHEQADQKSDA